MSLASPPSCASITSSTSFKWRQQVAVADCSALSMSCKRKLLRAIREISTEKVASCPVATSQYAVPPAPASPPLASHATILMCLKLGHSSHAMTAEVQSPCALCSLGTFNLPTCAARFPQYTRQQVCSAANGSGCGRLEEENPTA